MIAHEQDSVSSEEDWLIESRALDEAKEIEFARFLGISIRSVYETVAGCDLALTYGMIDGKLNEEIEKRAETLVKQLSAFRSSLLEHKENHKL